MLALRTTFFHNSTSFPGRFPLGCRRYDLQSCGLLAPPPSRAHLCRVHRHLRRLLTSAGSKPLSFVSLTSVSRDVTGTSSTISSVVPCPRSVLVALSLHPGSTLTLRKAECFLPFFSICSSTVSLSLFVLSSPVSPSLPLTSSVTSVSSMLMTLSFLTASRADFQMALDAVHAWGVRWRFSVWCRPHRISHYGLQ